MTQPEQQDPHGKRRAWRGFFWSFPIAIGVFALGIVMIAGASYLGSGIFMFLGLAICVMGTMQAVAEGFFGLLVAYVWEPLWEFAWFRWLASAALLAITILCVYAALFTDWLN